MKSKSTKVKLPKNNSQQNIDLPGYPHYKASDDIFSKEKEESKLDPENPKKVKSKNEPPGSRNEKFLDDDLTAGDLDIPGTELDDDMEDIGSEDEENNYYSLGDHEDDI